MLKLCISYFHIVKMPSFSDRYKYDRKIKNTKTYLYLIGKLISVGKTTLHGICDMTCNVVLTAWGGGGGGGGGGGYLRPPPPPPQAKGHPLSQNFLTPHSPQTSYSPLQLEMAVLHFSHMASSNKHMFIFLKILTD